MGDWALAFCTVIGAAVYLRAATALPALMLGDEVGPRAFPIMVGVGLLLAGGLLAVETWRKTPASDGTGAGQFPARFTLLGVLAWTLVYYAAFERAGYAIATLVYASALLLYFNRAGRWWNLVYAGGFTAAAWIVFARFLGVVLPPGLLAS